MPLQLPWAEMLVSAAGGGGLAKALDFIAARSRSKAYTMGAVDHAVQTAMKLVTDRLETVEGQHARCEESLDEFRTERAEDKREIASLKGEIDRLMAGPVAVYSPKAPGHG